MQLIGGCCLVVIYHSAIGQTSGVALLAEETFFSELGYGIEARQVQQLGCYLSSFWSRANERRGTAEVGGDF